MTPDLSVLIPARNERWLTRTVLDVLAHAKGNTDVIVVLDGAWPEEPLPLHPRLHVIYHPTPVGQRAATNEAARVSTARYVMKLDAHCAVEEGFDLKLLAAAEQLGPQVLQVPAQKNLHIYDWVCPTCGHRQYQGPPLVACPRAGCTGVPAQEIIWRPKRGTTTTAWRFDETLHFQYWKEGQARQVGDYPETMSLLGACWFLDRRWFLDELEGLDEGHGSWGNMGTELSCKVWLSGGRIVCNRTTWFAHFFRVGGIGFPYEIRHSDQEAARAYSRRLWLANAWSRQRYPLSSLVARFDPVVGWGPQAISAVMAAGAAFTPRDQSDASLWGEAQQVTLIAADSAAAREPVAAGEVSGSRQRMPSVAVGSLGLPSARAVSAEDVDPLGNQPKVCGVAASGLATHMVDDVSCPVTSTPDRAHEPGVHDAVQPGLPTVGASIGEAHPAVAKAIGVACPEPAAGRVIDANLRKDPSQVFAPDVAYGERLHPSRTVTLTAGIVYYSDSRGDDRMLEAVRRQLRHAAGGLPSVAVTLPAPDPYTSDREGWAPLEEFTGMRHVVLPLRRGYLTMARQILTGLELLDTDVVFFCEHDCLYPVGYFEHRPAPGVYEYAANTWKVDAGTGRALTYQMEQLSGLCGDRRLLLDHFRRRVAHLEAHGFSRRLGFEPGKPVRHGGLDDVPRATWANALPIVDIRHGDNLTPSRWRRDQFRNQKYTEGWTEADAVPGWGTTAGRFAAWLDEVTRHG